MIGELILSTLLQTGDLYSTHYAEGHRRHEIILPNSQGRYIVSGLQVGTETIGLSKLHGKWKVIGIIGMIGWKGYNIKRNFGK